MQKVIDWLRSDEGCQWSEDRMLAAKQRVNDHSLGLTHYGDATVLHFPGVLSVKKDRDIGASWNWRPSGHEASNQRGEP